MPYYAQINEAGICTAVTETHSELPAAANFIAIDGLHSEHLGKLYDVAASAAAGAPVFVDAPAQPLGDSPRRITKLAFRSRFTKAENHFVKESGNTGAPSSPVNTRPAVSFQ